MRPYVSAVPQLTKHHREFEEMRPAISKFEFELVQLPD